MMIRPILQVPHPTLHMPSVEVKEFTTGMRKLAGDMIDTMRHHKGLGLAAIQLGEPVQIITINPKCKIPFAVLINPKIIEKSVEMLNNSEQCFSIEYGKGPRITIRRHKAIVVAFLDRAGHGFQVKCMGMAAAIVQHECDHLAGKLITDYVKAA